MPQSDGAFELQKIAFFRSKIIINAKIFDNSDVAEYSWSRLLKYQNIAHTTLAIVKLHQIEKRHEQNAQTQAKQIKFCLVQAREYALAATTVSAATRPVLLYYSIMSLALAEILFKQTANSRLQKLREDHGCHGLTLSLGAPPTTLATLADAAALMIARQQTDKHGKPKGTFEVWRRSAREYPVVGEFTRASGTGQHTGAIVLMTASKDPLAPLPANGLSLIDCLNSLPYMADTLADLGSELRMIRATATSEGDEAGIRKQLQITVHPASEKMLAAFGELVKFPAATVNALDFNEYYRGYSIILNHEHPDGHHLSTPPAISISEKFTYFSCSPLFFNEFGYLYVALHICGNFARYYPDIWLKHIEESSPLALAIEELCRHALYRLPLLALSELTMTYHIKRH